MLLCAKCGKNERYVTPKGHILSVCASCGWENLQKALFPTPNIERSGQAHAPDGAALSQSEIAC